MTAPIAARPPTAAVAVAAGGCALLLARPLLILHAPPTAALLTLFAALLAVGALWPAARRRTNAPSLHPAVVLGLGVAAFALGRVAGGGVAPARLGLHLVAYNSLAAVAEEAFFRRFVYGLLEGHGVLAASAGSALLFAVVHVSVYGLWVLPLDLAAGLVLGWQRSASGTWAVPAVTHVLANLLVVV